MDISLIEWTFGRDRHVGQTDAQTTLEKRMGGEKGNRKKESYVI
jgi:hypothetical protein